MLLGFGLCGYVGVFSGSVETGALFYPFVRFDGSVSVSVWAEVSVAAYPCIRIGLFECTEQRAQRVALGFGPGVGRPAGGVEATFVGYPYACGVMAFGVCSDQIDGAHGMDDAFPGDVVVISAL